MILFVGSYGAGITIRVPRIPQAGETIKETELNITHGGKSSNQAVAAARYGAEAALITAIGADPFGESARELWDREGIDHSRVKVVAAATMAGAIIVEPNGENRIAIAPGALDELTPQEIETCREAFEAADVVVVCLEIPAASAERAITLGKECGATVVLNPAPAAPLDHLVIAQADYLIPNETEYEFLTAEAYSAPSHQTVICTRGAYGVDVISNGRCEHFRPLSQAEVVDTTGAGDTFVGTFAAAIDNDQAVAEAIGRAIVASSLSVTAREVIPSIPNRQAVDAAYLTYCSSQ